MKLSGARRPLESPGLPAHRTGLLRRALLCGSLLLLQPPRDAVLVEHVRAGAGRHGTRVACERWSDVIWRNELLRNKKAPMHSTKQTRCVVLCVPGNALREHNAEQQVSNA